MKYKCELSKKGYAAVAEMGGSWSHRGEATVVCDCNGERKTPIHTGHRCNEAHAVFFANNGDYIIEASRWRQEETVVIMQVVDNRPNEKQEIEVEKVNVFSKGEWDKDVPESLKEAIEQALRKCRSYHCREIYYALEKRNGIA